MKSKLSQKARFFGSRKPSPIGAFEVLPPEVHPFVDPRKDINEAWIFWDTILDSHAHQYKGDGLINGKYT
jgi:hypothetical protein